MESQPFELKDGHVFILAESAGGVYTSDQLQRVCEIAGDTSPFFKITEDQRVGFFASPENLEDIQEKLNSAGVLMRHYKKESLFSPRACLGEVCPQCQQDALGDAIEMVSLCGMEWEKRKADLVITLDGCSQRCVGGTETAGIHAVGGSQGYEIFLSGKKVKENVPSSELGKVILEIEEIYRLHRQEGESLAAFLAREDPSLFSRDSSFATQLSLMEEDIQETQKGEEKILEENEELLLSSENLFQEDGEPSNKGDSSLSEEILSLNSEEIIEGKVVAKEHIFPPQEEDFFADEQDSSEESSSVREKDSAVDEEFPFSENELLLEQENSILEKEKSQIAPLATTVRIQSTGTTFLLPDGIELFLPRNSAEGPLPQSSEWECGGTIIKLLREKEKTTVYYGGIRLVLPAL